MDCYSAMQFCLDTDKRYHKAAFQIGRARAAQGRTDEAVEELQDLFSNARLKFCINIWEIQGGPEAKVGPGRDGTYFDIVRAVCSSHWMLVWRSELYSACAVLPCQRGCGGRQRGKHGNRH